MSDSKTSVPDTTGADPQDAAQPHTRLTGTLRILALTTPFILFLGILAGIEGLVRVALPDVSTLDLLVQSALQQESFTDSEDVTIFEGDPLLFWRVRPSLDQVIWDYTMVSTNEQGLRRADDAPAQCAP